MDAGSSRVPIIRPMTGKDLQRIMEIDTRVLGQSRPEYWELKLELTGRKSPAASLVAELEGKVVGFIIGDASGWEYAVPRNIGWIDAIGVDPDYQRKGIAKMLLTEMVDNLKKLGVTRVYTFVNWRDWSLLRFFDGMGFRRGDMMNLELKV
ncbi:MAG: GNAT family N-acetyltransferase [Deltaproteobacteria bacterium]|nr:GNAT family N-acetyltransferase [Deltaproteobacteria bacterium]MBW2138420.1 GNAT family N-acetyltransferase [Deltaproteobacteria bacterium]